MTLKGYILITKNYHATLKSKIMLLYDKNDTAKVEKKFL